MRDVMQWIGNVLFRSGRARAPLEPPPPRDVPERIKRITEINARLSTGIERRIDEMFQENAAGLAARRQEN